MLTDSACKSTRDNYILLLCLNLVDKKACLEGCTFFRPKKKVHFDRPDVLLRVFLKGTNCHFKSDKLTFYCNA